MDFFTYVTLLSAGAVVLVQQILKLNIIPLSVANRFPVATNVVLSAIASLVAGLTSETRSHQGFWGWLVFGGTISVVAAITYNQLLGRSNTVKALEGPRTPAKSQGVTNNG